MQRSIIVPLDGSALAERALPYAAGFAKSRNAGAVLLRVALAPLPSGQNWEAQQIDAVEQAETYLQRVAGRLTQDIPTKIAVPYGRAAEQIVEAVAQFDAEAIVMATHGRTGLRHLLFGSVTESVLATATVPVLAVPTYSDAQTAPEDWSLRRVLVPLDGSSFAESATFTAFELLEPAGQLVLTVVVEEPDHVEVDESGRVRAYLDQQEEARKREASDYLHHVVNQIRQYRPDVDVTCDVRIGDPADGIAMAQAASGADLVVMATHGRTGLRRAIVGSVAGAVLRLVHTPVFLVKPGPSAARLQSTTSEPAAAAV